MAKEETIRTSGQVIDVLPNALFKIKLENGTEILGHISGNIRRNNINILMWDKVDIEISAYDLSKGRIVYRHKK